MDLYFQAWSKGFTFKGRATRSEFWIFLLSNIIIKIILGVISVKMGLFITNNPEEDRTLLDAFFTIAAFFPSIAVMIRRLHDINMSGWWGWLFIPLGLPMIIVGFIEGKEEQEQKQDEKFNTSPVSVMSAVVNHSKDAISKVKPAVADYVEKHQTVNSSKDTVSQIKLAAVESVKREENIFHDTVDYEINEDEIYAQAMTEIEEDKKVKGIWAKALALSEGDTNKETSLYIKLRANDIIEQKKRDTYNLEKQKIQALKDTEVWLDPETELMWELKTEENIDHRYVWSQEDVAQAQNPELLTDDVKDIFSYANKLNRNRFAGYDDWKIPRIDELKTLLMNEKSKNNGFEDRKYFIKEPLSKNSLDSYWSSTTDKHYKKNAWNVYFGVGYVTTDFKYNESYVRCVRVQ